MSEVMTEEQKERLQNLRDQNNPKIKKQVTASVILAILAVALFVVGGPICLVLLAPSAICGVMAGLNYKEIVDEEKKNKQPEQEPLSKTSSEKKSVSKAPTSASSLVNKGTDARPRVSFDSAVSDSPAKKPPGK